MNTGRNRGVFKSRGLVFYLLLVVACFISTKTFAGEDHRIDSVLSLINVDKDDDTGKVSHLNSLCVLYNITDKQDKALDAGKQALEMAHKLGFAKGEEVACNGIGTIYFAKKDYASALSYFEKALNSCEKEGKDAKVRMATLFDNIGLTYEAQGEVDKAEEYYNRAMKIADEIGNKQLQAYTMGNMGNFYTMQGDDSKALEYYKKAVQVKEEIGDKKGVARGSSNIATEYKGEGDYPKAIEYYNNALKMAQELGDKQLEADITSNIGAVYREQGDYSKALEYDFKALNLAEDLKYKQLQASAASSIGLIYWKRSDFSKALQYYNKALDLANATGDKSTAAILTDNIGIVCENQGDFPEALDYEFKALKISKDIGDKAGIAINTESIGEIYIKQKKYKDAEKYILEALYLSDTIHLLKASMESQLDLSELFAQTGQWQKAYDAYRQYVQAKDSLATKDNSKELGKLEAKAEYDKQAALNKAAEESKMELIRIDRKRKVIILGLVSTVAIALVLIALIVFRMLRTTRAQKQFIEQQKAEVESQKMIVDEKNKDIVDSITYAKRLQDAILPPMPLIKKYLPESFVLYKPKEIVAGDFYWMYTPSHSSNAPNSSVVLKGEGASQSPFRGLGQEHPSGEVTFIAVADCTGHGVPGAMVSVVCSNALNRTVKEFGITEPGKILSKVRELVLETFEKSTDDVNDGMDIALAAITRTDSGAKVKWATANASIWVKGAELKELNSGNGSIGKQGVTKDYVTHETELKKGDAIYFATDGFIKQLSGESNLFKETLLSVNGLPMVEIGNKLGHIFEQHKNGSEQVDDALVMGLRI
jgi:tetratricopeptide (TPR) repeat protein